LQRPPVVDWTAVVRRVAPTYAAPAVPLAAHHAGPLDFILKHTRAARVSDHRRVTMPTKVSELFIPRAAVRRDPPHYGENARKCGGVHAPSDAERSSLVAEYT